MPDSKTEPLPAVPPPSLCSAKSWALVGQNLRHGFWCVFYVGKPSLLAPKRDEFNALVDAGKVNPDFGKLHLVEGDFTFSPNDPIQGRVPENQ